MGIEDQVSSLSDEAYVEIAVSAGEEIAGVAEREGIPLEFPCGGQGRCGKCVVLIPEDAPPATASEEQHLTRGQLEMGVRLACQAVLTRDVVVRVPRRLLDRRMTILSAAEGRELVLEPNVDKVLVRVEDSSAEAPRTVWDRVRKELPGKYASAPVGWAAMRSLPALLRKGREMTVVAVGDVLIGLESGDTTDQMYGIAIDLGTTTVVGYLLDLRSGEELAVASALNEQGACGHDVMTRITHAARDEGGLDQLRDHAVSTVNGVVGELLLAAGIAAGSVYEMTFVGNASMHHFLMGLDPASLGAAPYVPVWRDCTTVRACDLGLRVNPNARVYYLPHVAGFVGADTVGVLLTTLLHEREALTLAIDVGTNGEIVLGSHDRVLACSAAAGPAFEGAQIVHGMSATEGAIDRVCIVNGDVECSTIGATPARGICGSGLIDMVACLLDLGIVDPSGRMVDDAELPATLDPRLRERLEGEGEGRRFVLVHPESGGACAPIALTQRDVREVQLAKAAILAGIQVLQGEWGVRDAEIEQVLLAGAFGNFVDTRHARRVGLLPHVPVERIRYVGNAAGFGAKIALLSTKERRRAEAISRSVEYVELTTHPEFQDFFLGAVNFPPPCRIGDD